MSYAYQYLLPQVPYYGPTTYTYLPSVSAAFPGMPPLQCMESCCSAGVPTPYGAVATQVCVDTCCNDAPDIIINNTGGGCTSSCCVGPAPDIVINNVNSGCVDSCCSYVAYPTFYEDTCNTTSSYYLSSAPIPEHKKDEKAYYRSYGTGYMMM